MFKQFGKKVLLMLVASGLLMVSTHAQSAKGDGDSWVPWPWGFEAPFPWRDIHGMWSVEDEGATTYFSFKVVREKTTKGRQLVVKQLDADGCKVVATGVGYEYDNVIRAQMKGTSGTFRVTLRAFALEDSPMPPRSSQFYMSSIMVLSVTNLDWEAQAIHLPMAKVSDSVAQKACLDAEKNKK